MIPRKLASVPQNEASLSPWTVLPPTVNEIRDHLHGRPDQAIDLLSTIRVAGPWVEIPGPVMVRLDVRCTLSPQDAFECELDLCHVVCGSERTTRAAMAAADAELLARGWALATGEWRAGR